jgi:hypothetical protein
MKEYIPEMVLLALVGCSTTPTTDEEKEEQLYIETERRAMYQLWEKSCELAGGIIFVNNPMRPCTSRNCIPHRHDWKWNHDRNRPHIGNRFLCVSRSNAL